MIYYLILSFGAGLLIGVLLTLYILFKVAKAQDEKNSLEY